MSRNHWTPEQLATLRRLYPTTSPQDVAAAIGCSVKRVYDKAHNEGLKSACLPLSRPKPKPTLASRPGLPGAKSAKAPVRGPAYLDGPLVFTAATKRTVVEPSPQRTLRTNTFAD